MELTLKDFFSIILKNIWIIILSVLAAATCGYIIARITIAPEYTTRTSLLIWYNNPDSGASSAANDNALTYSRNLVSNCLELMRQNKYYSALAEELLETNEIDLSASEIESMITFSNQSGTSIIVGSVVSESSEHSYRIAKAIDAVTSDYLKDVYPVLNDNYAGISGNINDIMYPSGASGPNYTNYGIAGACIGLIVSVGLSVLISVLDLRIKDVKRLTNTFDVPLLGVIPPFEIAPSTTGIALKKIPVEKIYDDSSAEKGEANDVCKKI